MKRNGIWIAMICVVFLFSCKSTRQTQTTVEPAQTASLTTDEMIEQSIRQRSDFVWFSANLSGMVDIDGDVNSFSGQLRIKSGEEIWITMSKMGFEIARLKVTQDSVFLFNKLQKSAIVSDFTFFKNATGVDFTFAMLQDILLGNYFLGEAKGEYTSEFVDDVYRFQSNKSKREFQCEFDLNKNYYKFTSLTLKDTKNRSVTASYANYSFFNDDLYPQKITLKMQKPLAMDLQLVYQKIQINVPLSMPFSIPEGVTRGSL